MIKIVTVYQTLNPGSFLQATALYETALEQYNEVSFFNTKARHPFLSGVKLTIKLLLKGKISYAIKQYKMVLDYHKELKVYQKTTKKYITIIPHFQGVSSAFSNFFAVKLRKNHLFHAQHLHP